MIHVTKGRARVGLLSNNGRKNMQKKPVINVSNKATAYPASSGLSSVLARDIRLFGRLSGLGLDKRFCRIYYQEVVRAGRLELPRPKAHGF